MPFLALKSMNITEKLSLKQSILKNNRITYNYGAIYFKNDKFYLRKNHYLLKLW